MKHQPKLRAGTVFCKGVEVGTEVKFSISSGAVPCFPQVWQWFTPQAIIVTSFCFLFWGGRLPWGLHFPRVLERSHLDTHKKDKQFRLVSLCFYGRKIHSIYSIHSSNASSSSNSFSAFIQAPQFIEFIQILQCTQFYTITDWLNNSRLSIQS